jgi:hypothetical protein
MHDPALLALAPIDPFGPRARGGRVSSAGTKAPRDDLSGSDLQSVIMRDHGAPESGVPV